MVQDIQDDIKTILESANRGASTSLTTLKNINNTLDAYIPGYSGFKQYHVGFWVMKKVYNTVVNNESADDCNKAIAFVKSITDDRWKYATKHLKINLIAEMCTAGTTIILLDGGAAKRKAMLKILGTARTDSEFAGIMEGVQKLKNSPISNEFTNGNQGELNTLKTKFHYS